jgi:signal transduction histidine kinase
MGISNNSPATPGGKSGSRVLPKPYSIERRFRMLEAGTITIVILLISSVLYWNFSVQEHLKSSLQTLHSTLALNREIDLRHDAMSLAFWELYDNEPSGKRSKYDDRVREANELLERYDSIPLSPEEQTEVVHLKSLHRDFLALADRELVRPNRSLADVQQRDAIATLDSRFEASLNWLADLQIQRLEDVNSDVNRFSRWLAVSLLLLAAFALAAMVSFRRIHRSQLWEPLEELRQMVAEVRRGNLNVTAEIPESVELGSFVRAFLEMADELRDSHDLLEQKVIERTASLATAQSELLQAAKLASLGQLVSGVAHEINNPLTSILGFSELALGRPGVEPALRASLQTIRSEAIRLRDVVVNLTGFARRAPHRTEVVDIRKLFGRFVELRNYQLQSNNIWLHVEQPPEAVNVMADPDQLLQVILNLVINAEQAIKSSHDRGEIRLACGIEGERAWLSVRDNGAGMTDEVREHIFDPFYTTKPAGEGTGLGLSISHGIIIQHGGEISVESQAGSGTLIRISLPLAPELPVVSASTPSQHDGKQLTRAGFHALVIDDERDILEMVEQALMKVHCRATLLHGSANIEAALAKGPFDLVICDLKMPDKNGLEVFRLIRAQQPQLAAHFILMTGNFADADRHAKELANVLILAKPFTLAQLREAVELLLARPTAP